MFQNLFVYLLYNKWGIEHPTLIKYNKISPKTHNRGQRDIKN